MPSTLRAVLSCLTLALAQTDSFDGELANDALASDDVCNSEECALELRQLRGLKRGTSLSLSGEDSAEREEQADEPSSTVQPSWKRLPEATLGKVQSTVQIPTFVGVAYTAVPTKKYDKPKCDDFMAAWSANIWGPSGRDDLKIIRDMGANVVRTYGVGSQLDHKAFLDHAHSLGLKVIPGFADFAYFPWGSQCAMKGKLPENCVRGNGGDCFSTIKAHYKEMLLNGYTVVGDDGKRRYHPAVFVITVGNEVELKMHMDPNHVKVVVSALDGLLAAEEEVGVVGEKPFLTSSVSYATCPKCKSQKMGFPGLSAKMPFLPFVADYYYGVQDPEGYAGYKAQHDLFAAYKSRWISSYNTARPSAAICDTESKVLAVYNESPLGSVPIYISEFHHSFLTPQQFKEDILQVQKIIHNEDNGTCGGSVNPLVGFNIFEYQISYWKGAKGEGGAAMRYGMWGMGHRTVAGTTSNSDGGEPTHEVWCLKPSAPLGKLLDYEQESNAKSVIEALGGKWPDKSVLC